MTEQLSDFNTRSLRNQAISRGGGYLCPYQLFLKNIEVLGETHISTERLVHNLNDLFVNQRIKLNIIRLLLAAGVVLAHTFPLGGFGQDPFASFGAAGLGSFCVGGFFALSGYVITRSAMNSSLKVFLLSRLFRIWPGLLLALLLGAFVFLPIIQIFQGRFDLNYFKGEQLLAALRYVFWNLSLPINLQWDINGGPTGIPYPGSINGSLWTLPVEIRAYLISLVLVKVGQRFGRGLIFIPAVSIAGFLVFLKNVYPEWIGNFFTVSQGAELIFIFLCSGALATAGRNFLVKPRIVALSVICLAAGLIVPNASVSLCLLISLVVLIPLATNLFKERAPKVFENDYSFGLYVYAFPIQQAIAASNLIHEPAGFFLASLVAGMALAIPSWHLVEKPLLKLKDKIVKQGF